MRGPLKSSGRTGFIAQQCSTCTWRGEVLKGGIVEASGPGTAPYTHNLVVLAGLTGLDMPEEMLQFLDTLAPQAVSARYSLTGEGYSESFYLRLRLQADEVITWLRSHLG